MKWRPKTPENMEFSKNKRQDLDSMPTTKLCLTILKNLFFLYTVVGLYHSETQPDYSIQQSYGKVYFDCGLKPTNPCSRQRKSIQFKSFQNTQYYLNLSSIYFQSMIDISIFKRNQLPTGVDGYMMIHQNGKTQNLEFAP